jgi:hypothetical protein
MMSLYYNRLRDKSIQLLEWSSVMEGGCMYVSPGGRHSATRLWAQALRGDGFSDVPLHIKASASRAPE